MKFLPARRLPRLAMILAVVAGAGAATAGVASAGAASPRATAEASHHAGELRGCERSLRGWTEQTMQYFVTGKQAPALPAREVGNGVIYNDFVYDRNNQHVGHAIGYVSVTSKRPDGHLISKYHVSYDLPGGQLNATGTIDRTAMFQGALVRFDVRGVSGSYAGRHGVIRWRLLKVPADINTRVSLDMTLCGRSS